MIYGVKDRPYQIQSLIRGNWFKLICGASYQHLPTVRSLAMIYSLAGADCIDVAADKAVVFSAKEGIATAAKLNNSRRKPLLMISLNDDEDPHFRKAEFDITQCPTSCPRPCESICPAQAINNTGVIDSLCYGCGRCIPICPENLILARSYVSTPQTIIPLIKEMDIEGIEIHTQSGHFEQFSRLWATIHSVVPKLKVLAISCQDAPDVVNYMRSLYTLISPLPCSLIWQTDGRPMSGDIGAGTTHAAVKFAQKIIDADLPGYVQLAGGTNSYTVTKLNSAQMLKNCHNNDSNNHKKVSGVAYGSYARSLVLPILEQLETLSISSSVANALENNPQLLNQAVVLAQSLVTQIKTQVPRQITSNGDK